MKIILITGGCRSGKSKYALNIASSLQKRGVTFIATAEAFDSEMEDRIKRHKTERSKEWKLIEEPIYIGKAVADALLNTEVVLLDCITLWISNLLMKHNDYGEEDISLLIDEFISQIKNLDGTLIIVTNEVGLGIVPADKLSRLYRDCVGRVNQKIGKEADEVYLLVCGIAQKIK